MLGSIYGTTIKVKKSGRKLVVSSYEDKNGSCLMWLGHIIRRLESAPNGKKERILMCEIQ